MTRWSWHHAEFRSHDGWIPQIVVQVRRNGEVEIHKLGGDPAEMYDTKTAARSQNTQLALEYAEKQGWKFVSSEAEPIGEPEGQPN